MVNGFARANSAKIWPEVMKQPVAVRAASPMTGRISRSFVMARASSGSGGEVEQAVGDAHRHVRPFARRVGVALLQDGIELPAKVDRELGDRGLDREPQPEVVSRIAGVEAGAFQAVGPDARVGI